MYTSCLRLGLASLGGLGSHPVTPSALTWGQAGDTLTHQKRRE